MAKTGMPEREPLVSADAAAAYIGRSVSALYQLRHKGIGPPAYRIDNRLSFRLSELDEWLAERREPSTAA